MISVLHLGKGYAPDPGGMERVLEMLCRADRRSIDSRALVVNTDRTTRRGLVQGVPVTRAGLLARVGSVALSAALVTELRRSDADILVLHEPNPMALLAFALVRPRRRLVIWYHSEVVRPAWRYALFYHPVLSVALRRAIRIVVSSPALAEHARALERFRDRCVVIPFGTESRCTESTCAAEGRPTSDPVVLFVGRLVPYKGVDVLIRAMAHVEGDAIVIGDGPERDRLESLAARTGVAPRVRFLGRVSDQELEQWYARCDVLVLPSVTRQEAFGMVQIEAMARGKPVISTAVPTGVPWVNQDGVTGFVVPPGDAMALASSLRRLLTDAELKSRMGAAARQRATTEFSAEATIARATALYSEVMAEAPVRPLAWSKRLLDVLLASAGLIMSSPLWGMIAALIRLEDGGPVFYRQDRVGLGGRRFAVLKFRSMIPDAEAAVGALQAMPEDARITRVGRVLRATAMDELPQLWNILRGDMSFVGPRALRPGEIDAGSDGRVVRAEDIPGFAERTSIVPGLTGIAQIYAARDVPRRQKFRYDRLYVRRRSFWRDIGLILLSFWISARGTWEQRGRKY